MLQASSQPWAASRAVEVASVSIEHRSESGAEGVLAVEALALGAVPALPHRRQAPKLAP